MAGLTVALPRRGNPFHRVVIPFLLDHPAAGAETQRLRQPRSAADATVLVRGTVHPKSKTVRLQIRSGQVDRIDGQDRNVGEAPGSGPDNQADNQQGVS